jgi:hypothetical protein
MNNDEQYLLFSPLSSSAAWCEGRGKEPQNKEAQSQRGQNRLSNMNLISIDTSTCLMPAGQLRITQA